MRIERLAPLLALLALLQACVAVNPVQTQNEKASAVNVQLGIGYLQQNKLSLASEKLTKAIRQDPESAPAHNAYAILQERLKQLDKAAYHYERATSLDENDSQAANNYGAFLCRNNRELESEKYFLQAVNNPLYSTPEFAYTNAALCLLKVEEYARAKDYLNKALASKSDFAPALLTMGRLLFEQGDYSNAHVYLDRYHLVGNASAHSLWLSIRNSLKLDPEANVSEFSTRLETDFPNSPEYQSWLDTQ